jgi:hypothetical protein
VFIDHQPKYIYIYIYIHGIYIKGAHGLMHLTFGNGPTLPFWPKFKIFLCFLNFIHTYIIYIHKIHICSLQVCSLQVCTADCSMFDNKNNFRQLKQNNRGQLRISLKQNRVCVLSFNFKFQVSGGFHFSFFFLEM